MNDRLKYRLWAKDIEMYFNGPLIYINTDGKLVAEDGVKVYEIDQKAYIVEFCTGLKDKNGKLIYENDLIKCPNGIYRIATDDFGLWTAIYDNNPLKDVVEWSDIVKNYAFNQENIKIEVVGNIHENKELLDA